ncbi:DGQHR domain-containing protein [Psychroflexus sediminis]|uniref:DNA sulfur modification protein DndB n=1 Tax=Psychroflexus sediminis TaxID=470826 RepID=A0A1G7V978_9FLAO|nr:DNA sulfur modification protein DndB [Psychroflexus sediminis]SDG56091.1 DNA sulfur modification protein DndB [Psychroflexus sediminis]
MIHLACTHGNLGYWDFYSTVMKVEDIVDDKRIITVSESAELFSENINEILQREINLKRIKAISEYISSNDERFLGSIVVAIHKGEPKWTEIDLNQSFKIDDDIIDEKSLAFLNGKFGVLTLTGNEQIFALDGQHRLMGLRKTLKDYPELGELEVPVVFVIHNHERLDKTRRLFTVLNKYAEKPKGAELIILDEDDCAAIVARKLVSDHEILSKGSALSTTKSGSMPNSDNYSLTTLVTISSINKILFNKRPAYYTVRPSDDQLESHYEEATAFWDSVFDTFPEINQYLNKEANVTINSKPIYRNHESGGSLLLRPVGQKLLAFAFTKFGDDEIELFKERLSKIDFNLSNSIWKYLFWNEKMVTGENRLKKNLILYLLGKFDDESYIHSEMSRIYELNNDIYTHNISPV